MPDPWPPWHDKPHLSLNLASMSCPRPPRLGARTTVDDRWVTAALAAWHRPSRWQPSAVTPFPWPDTAQARSDSRFDHAHLRHLSCTVYGTHPTPTVPGPRGAARAMAIGLWMRMAPWIDRWHTPTRGTTADLPNSSDIPIVRLIRNVCGTWNIPSGSDVPKS